MFILYHFSITIGTCSSPRSFIYINWLDGIDYKYIEQEDICIVHRTVSFCYGAVPDLGVGLYLPNVARADRHRGIVDPHPLF